MDTIRSAILAYLRRFPFDQGKTAVKGLLLQDAYRDGVVMHTSAAGIAFKLDLSDHVQREIFLHDCYERNTFRHLKRLVPPSAVILDCGANIGAYSIPLAKHAAFGFVHSFEPHPRTMSRLQENIALNQLRNITPVPLGLSDTEETVKLFGSSATTASAYKHQESGQHVEIRCTTIDSYCEANSIDQVGFMKVDIEGGEFKCLKGAQKVIRRSPAMVLQVEIDSNCEHSGVSRESLFNFVTDMGFIGWRPRGFPLGMERLTQIPADYSDNVIFTRR